MNALRPQWWLGNIGSGNDVLLSGDKQAITWTIADQILWHQVSSWGQNELHISILWHNKQLTTDDLFLS